MKKHLSLFVTLAWLAGTAILLHAQGTAFTYQGRLNENGSPANGHYDLAFAVCSGPTGLNMVSDLLTNSATPVVSGVFTTTLDFGAGVFGGSERWLLISVRTNGGGAFTPLDPRQPLTPTPYAIYARKAALLDGLLPPSQLSGLYPAALTLNNPANSFSGNGAGLTGLNAAELTTGTVPAPALSNAWKIGGNAGTTPGTHFLGTTDNQPLELKVNQSRALRLEPGSESVNVLGGSRSNSIAAGATGVTIAGGGQYLIRLPPQSPIINPNEAGTAADYAAIAGGYGNRVDALASTIAGGHLNKIQAGSTYASIGGGRQNTIQTNAQSATLGGGYRNTIQTNADYSTLGGGEANTIQTNADHATIGGGLNNTIEYISPNATIAGGEQNTIQRFGVYSTIGGGANNTNLFNTEYATIGGGERNTSGGWWSTVPGGAQNTAGGQYSFAAGQRAKANHPGTFVWADSTDADFFSAAANEFAVRAAGGVRLETGGAGLKVDGRVGIGNAAPGYPLDVMASRAVGRFISTNDFSGSVIELRNDTPAAGLLGRINFYSTNTFHGQIAYRADNDSMTFEVAGAERLRIDSQGRVGIGTASPQDDLDVRGTTRTCVLTITGGCDLAEPFDTTTEDIPPGSVVVIDPSQPGKLKVSHEPYDRKVAGVVSGANGINPGITLSQTGALEGTINVALTGRVYVLGDASKRSIEPGDLLTTSDSPGHSMKVSDYARAQGAILGKAMTGLAEGKGLVLVLVTLQ